MFKNYRDQFLIMKKGLLEKVLESLRMTKTQKIPPDVVFLRKIVHPEQSLPLEYVLHDVKFYGIMSSVVKKVKRLDRKSMWYSVTLVLDNEDQSHFVGYMYGFNRASDFAYEIIKGKAFEMAKEKKLEVRDVTQDPSEVILRNYHPARLPKYRINN